MLVKKYHPGDRIPEQKIWFFVMEDGHFVQRVNLVTLTVFPKLTHPRQYYICAG